MGLKGITMLSSKPPHIPHCREAVSKGSSFLSGGHKVFLRVFPRLSVGSVTMLELLASYKHTKRKIYQE
ncbi:hypothetical protein MAR_014917 [Mya arenaria]|uniref:Uncharacterized protein n=1 Tax=Mya arenaria TaxID=6604 RepID=A0ABY7FFI2_MYAAR|nr:hypothetical protein MAR_014917 [Mya arenaria]